MALRDYNQAIELDPSYAKAYSNRGNTYAALQQYQVALVDYGQAIELDPTFAEAYSNRGNTYATLQQYEAALADYGRTIELDPNDAGAYTRMDLLFAMQGNVGEALPYLDKAAQIGDPQVKQLIAQVRQMLGI